MLARLVFDSIKYLDERAKESNDLNQRNKQCLVILHREIALNAELLFECARFGIQAGLKKQLLMSTQDAAIEAISHIGITVSSLFDKDNLSWSPQQSRVTRLERGQYKKRLDRIHNKQVLIERSYHRLKLHASMHSPIAQTTRKYALRCQSISGFKVCYFKRRHCLLIRF